MKTLALLLLAALPAAAEDAARLDAVLAGALGPDRARAFVRTEKRSVPRKSRAPAAALWDRMQRRVEGAPPVLPGFEVPRSLKDEAVRQLKHEAYAARPTRVIWRRHVTLLIDPAVAEDAVDAARKIALEALALKLEKGETLKVLRMPLAAALAPPRGGLLGWAQTALLAGMLLLVGFWLVHLAPRRGGWARAPVPIPGIWSPGRHPELARLSRRQARSVAGFLSAEKPADAARLLGALDVETAATVFAMLPPGPRAQIARHLVEEAEAEAAKTKAEGPAETRLLARLEAERRREGLLFEILLRSPQSLREEVLGELDAGRRAAARRLRLRLVRMEDLGLADPAALRTCLSPFSVRELALALYETAEPARRQILGALPALLGEQVERDLRTLVPDHLDQVDAVRARLYARWNRLELSGRVRPLTAAALLLALALAAPAAAQELGLPGTNRVPAPAARPAPEPGVDDAVLRAAEADLFGEEPTILPSTGEASAADEPMPGVPPRAPVPEPEIVVTVTPAPAPAAPVRELLTVSAPPPAAAEPAAPPPTGAGQELSDDEKFERGSRRARMIEKLGGPEAYVKALRPDDYGGDELAARALDAYVQGRALKAVLLAQAALGADPGNEERRELLRALAEFTGVPVDHDGILPLSALAARETRLADAAFFAERFGEALQACRRALLLTPQSPEAWTRLGSVHYALGDHDRARAAYTRALALRPQSDRLRTFLKERGWLAKK